MPSLGSEPKRSLVEGPAGREVQNDSQALAGQELRIEALRSGWAPRLTAEDAFGQIQAAAPMLTKSRTDAPWDLAQGRERA